MAGWCARVDMNTWQHPLYFVCCAVLCYTLCAVLCCAVLCCAVLHPLFCSPEYNPIILFYMYVYGCFITTIHITWQRLRNGYAAYDGTGGVVVTSTSYLCPRCGARVTEIPTKVSLLRCVYEADCHCCDCTYVLTATAHHEY